MRSPVAMLSPVASLAVAVPAALLVGAAPASAADACSLPLDANRTSVHPFSNNARTLGFGRVVVQATRDQYHRYCASRPVGARC